MTASERLYELARGGEGIRFSSAEVLALASLVEAAERYDKWVDIDFTGPDLWENVQTALAALRDALQPNSILDEIPEDVSMYIEGSPPPPEGDRT